MPPEAAERRLAAILSADVAGYTRLLAEDEDATVRMLADCREVIGALAAQHRGRVVDAPGDNVMAEFPAASDAVQCAVEIQRVLQVRNAPLPVERRMLFRIGLHLGEVRAEGERLYGDGVNVAARLEGLAEPGAICLSDVVERQVRARLSLVLEDLGEQRLKNVPEPVRAHLLRVDEPARAAPRPRARRFRRLRVAAGAFAAMLLLGAAAVWLSWPRPLGLLLDFYGLGGPPVNPPLPDKPSLVVLPFTNLSGDPEQEYFADGITEDLTTDLTSIPWLFVIARNSAFTYKGKPVKVKDVGRELGVRYVLEGSVRKVGSQVRITAQLIDATRDVHLWSKRYDREIADIFALQSEISEAILGSLSTEVEAAEHERIRRKPTDDLSAYDALMRARFHLVRNTREDVLEARRLMASAIELDPNYAMAHSMLGMTYVYEYLSGWNLDPGLVDRAEELGRRALELDLSLPGGHMVLAMTNLSRRRVAEAVAAAQNAVELAPNWDLPHFILASALTGQGQFLDAAQEVHRALRLNPHPPPMYLMGLGWVNFRAGRTQKAVELWEQARSANPDDLWSRVALSSHYEAEGRHAEARELAQEIQRVNPALTAEQAARLAAERVDPEYAARVAELLRRAGLPETAPAAATDFTVPGFGGAPAIAVLAFDNLSGDPDQEYFADGIAEDLITRLSLQRDFPVIARNSSFTYKGKAVDVKQVSRELGVRYVVEGSVRKAVGRVRISAQLIDATSGHHVWAESYDRELRDVFAVQDEISQAIIASISPAMHRSEWMRAVRKSTPNLSAYDLAMRGSWHLFKFTKEDNAKARALFEKASELDAQAARSLDGLAFAHYLDILYQWTDSPARSLDEQLRAARRCVEVEANWAPCRVSLALGLGLQGQRDPALAAAALAVELNPSENIGHVVLCFLLVVTGRPDEGISHCETAIRLSPRAPSMWMTLHVVALGHFAAGRYEQAVQWERRSLQLRRAYYITHGTLAASHAHLGQLDQARAALEEMLQRNPQLTAPDIQRVFSPADDEFVERWIEGLRKAGWEG